MGEGTAIEWADHTFNPWWGCTHVSPACDHCYAETFARRLGMDLWERGGGRRTFGDKHWDEPLAWARKAAADGIRRRVFCASMADVFEDHPDVHGERTRLWELIVRTPELDWLLLTKRPQNVLRMVPAIWTTGAWPANVWAGTTVENPRYALLRVPQLLEVPAPVRFLSIEPLLDEVRLARWLWHQPAPGSPWEPAGQIHWVIVGGESGHQARPLDARWVRILQRECDHARVPFLFKQWGGRTPKAGGRLLDGRTWDDVPHPHNPEGARS